MYPEVVPNKKEVYLDVKCNVPISVKDILQVLSLGSRGNPDPGWILIGKVIMLLLRHSSENVFTSR